MKALAAFIIFSTPQDESVVPLRIEEMTASADYVAVQKALATMPDVTRVSFWVDKENYHFHVATKGAVRLSAVQSALAAAMKDLKDTLQMEVAYKLDESRVEIASEATVFFTGGEAVIEAIRVLVPAKVVETRDGRTEARVTPKDAPVTLAALRKAVEDAGEKLADVLLPGRRPPKPLYVCPDRCAEAAGPGICPKCGRDLVKIAEAPAAGG